MLDIRAETSYYYRHASLLPYWFSDKEQQLSGGCNSGAAPIPPYLYKDASAGSRHAVEQDGAQEIFPILLFGDRGKLLRGDEACDCDGLTSPYLHLFARENGY